MSTPRLSAASMQAVAVAVGDGVVKTGGDGRDGDSGGDVARNGEHHLTRIQLGRQRVGEGLGRIRRGLQLGGRLPS